MDKSGTPNHDQLSNILKSLYTFDKHEKQRELATTISLSN